jgi:hypothetical protein
LPDATASAVSPQVHCEAFEIGEGAINQSSVMSGAQDQAWGFFGSNDSCQGGVEEPEITLPPHTQRRTASYLIKSTSRCFVTTHSTYVIECFEPSRKCGKNVAKMVNR